jgi:uncharacterized protein (TIGR02145 family)
MMPAIPTITTDLTDMTLGCDPTFTPPTATDFTVTDECNSSATATVTASAETVDGHSHFITWTATYTNVCGQEAEPKSVTYTWNVAPEMSISCPPDVRDTLAYGDCAMNIYPDQIGTPRTTIEPADWPFKISNDIPEDHLFYENDSVFTWTIEDLTCGTKVTCEQKIVVVFPQCPDAVDCEGNTYHGVRIGCDCWTQTNLVSNFYGNPYECVRSRSIHDPIPCVYEYQSTQHPNVEENVEIFGKLYCPAAGVGDSVINEYGHIRGICPQGWYLPSPEKYEELYGYGVYALRSPLYWCDGNGGNNSTDFSWLPAGYYNGVRERFEGMMSESYFLSTEVVNGEVRTYVFELRHSCDEIQKKETHAGHGYSVRCVKERN